MGKARPVSLFPLDFEKAIRGLLAVPKEAVEYVKPNKKRKKANRAKKKSRCKNQSSCVVLVALMCLGVLASCTGHDSHQGAITSSPIRTIAPNPDKTPYLGIEKMWKGHIQAIDRNVLIIWVNPSPGADPRKTPIDVFRHIESSLHQSDLQIVIIKVNLAQHNAGTLGLTYSKVTSDVFVKADNGLWASIDDPTLLSKIIRAGL